MPPDVRVRPAGPGRPHRHRAPPGPARLGIAALDQAPRRAAGKADGSRGRMQKWWTFAAVLGLAYWFFGNLYEAVVFSPNWVVDSAAQIDRLNAFFVNT